MEGFRVAIWDANTNTPLHFAEPASPRKALRNCLLERKSKSGGEIKFRQPELIGTLLLTANLCSKMDKLSGEGKK